MSPSRPHLVFFGHPDAFLDRAQDWLVREEARYNRILGLARAARTVLHGRPPLLATIESADDLVVGCVMLPEGQQLDLTDMPQAAIEVLVAELLRRGVRPRRFGGPPLVAAAFARAWEAETGEKAISRGRHGVHACERLIEPARTGPGRLMPAADAHIGLLAEWMADFGRSTGLMLPEPSSLLASLRSTGGLYVLLVEREVVCMGAVSRTTPSGAALSFIYSPPERRGLGHATTLTAMMTRTMLAAGFRFCCLHTDLDNPVSNRIYHGLGYRLVAETLDLERGEPS